MDIVKVDAFAQQKNPKRHFLRAIGNSFNEVTWRGLEPHQSFSFCNISTNMVARGIQSWSKWAFVGRLFEIWPKFFNQICADMWWTNAENFKKLSWFLFDLWLYNQKFVATNGLQLSVIIKSGQLESICCNKFSVFQL